MFKSPEALTLASPFSPGYWRVAAKEVKNLRMLTLAAIVVVSLVTPAPEPGVVRTFDEYNK